MFRDNQDLEFDALEPRESFLARRAPFMKWTPTSSNSIKETEEEFLRNLKTPSEGFYVNIGDVRGSPCKIWTRVYNSSLDTPTSLRLNPPIVLLHGFAAGSALWALNIDYLCSRNQTVLTLDLPGFARSSRCKFSSNGEKAEEEFVECLERWRLKVGLEKMILVGHSFGGYLSLCYALKHDETLHQLVLVDPWGMTERSPEESQWLRERPLGLKLAWAALIKPYNPLWVLRVSGPAGPRLASRLRPDLANRFVPLLGEENVRVVLQYLYHCNAQPPTGESAFKRLSDNLAWAKQPLVTRLHRLSSQLKVTIIYGSNSWISPKLTETEVGANISIITIEDATHHVYADQFEAFNEILIKLVENGA